MSPIGGAVITSSSCSMLSIRRGIMASSGVSKMARGQVGHVRKEQGASPVNPVQCTLFCRCGTRGRTRDLRFTKPYAYVDPLRFKHPRAASTACCHLRALVLLLIWCRVSDSNRRPTAYRTTSAFAASRLWSGLSLGHSKRFRPPPSSLYTFPLSELGSGSAWPTSGCSLPRI
jgi:hypothetical protein